MVQPLRHEGTKKFGLIAELIGPDLYDIYLRVIVLYLLIWFGSSEIGSFSLLTANQYYCP